LADFTPLAAPREAARFPGERFQHQHPPWLTNGPQRSGDIICRADCSFE
jgi:hypothetical protein